MDESSTSNLIYWKKMGQKARGEIAFTFPKGGFLRQAMTFKWMEGDSNWQPATILDKKL